MLCSISNYSCPFLLLVAECTIWVGPDSNAMQVFCMQSCSVGGRKMTSASLFLASLVLRYLFLPCFLLYASYQYIAMVFMGGIPYLTFYTRDRLRYNTFVNFAVLFANIFLCSFPSMSQCHGTHYKINFKTMFKFPDLFHAVVNFY